MAIDAFHGDKKRTGVYGAFLLACYDSNNEEFQSSCEVGIGFSEAMLKPQRMFVRSPFKRDTQMQIPALLRVCNWHRGS